MDIDIIVKSTKEFEICKNDEVVIKGFKPKWYSSASHFFFSNQTYEIKKKSFFSSEYNIFKSGKLRGEFVYYWKTGYSFKLLDANKSTHSYSMKVERPKGWLKNDLLCTLYDDNNNAVLSLRYVWKKWKASMQAEIVDSVYENYELLVYTLMLFKLYQQAQSAGAGMISY
jgi:hypothetical protein